MHKIQLAFTRTKYAKTLDEMISPYTTEKKKEETKRKKRETEEERKSARTRRSKDGSWAVKNKRLHFGYKLHTIQDAHNDMIINYSTIKA